MTKDGVEMLRTAFLCVWLPRVLFRGVLGIAVLLIALVLASPWLDNGKTEPHGWPWLVAAFARDITLRRTALASGIGLVVTSWVFFRPGVMAADRAQRWVRKQPTNSVGA